MGRVDVAGVYLWWKDTQPNGERWNRYIHLNSEDEALEQAVTEDGMVALKITKDEEGDDVLHDKKSIDSYAKK